MGTSASYSPQQQGESYDNGQQAPAPIEQDYNDGNDATTHLRHPRLATTPTRSTTTPTRHRPRYLSTISHPPPIPTTSGRPATGPGALPAITGFPAPGCRRPTTALSGRRPTGAGTAAVTASTTATGARTSASTAASTTASATSASATSVASGVGMTSTTTARSTTSAASTAATSTTARSSTTVAATAGGLSTASATTAAAAVSTCVRKPAELAAAT